MSVCKSSTQRQLKITNQLPFLSIVSSDDLTLVWIWLQNHSLDFIGFWLGVNCDNYAAGFLYKKISFWQRVVHFFLLKELYLIIWQANLCRSMLWEQRMKYLSKFGEFLRKWGTDSIVLWYLIICCLMKHIFIYLKTCNSELCSTVTWKLCDWVARALWHWVKFWRDSIS